MRYVEIDGKKYDVSHCFECPCYDGGDDGYGESCRHPEGDGNCAHCTGYIDQEEEYGPHCPLREAKE